MHPPDADTVVVRYGEPGTKSRNVRRRMERRLRDNVAAALDDRGVDGEVERFDARILVRTTDAAAAAEAARAAADVPGVVSASAAERVEPSMDAVTDALARAAEACYGGGAFAVDARRATDHHEFTSRDVNEEGGAAVWEAVEDRFDPEVDLDDPDVTFGVEVRDEVAFVDAGREDGPGGLPVGSQAPMVALVSGGIDSPVAAHEVLRRGSPVVPVYVDLGDYGGPDHRARAMATVARLRRYAPQEDWRPYVVDAGEAMALLDAEMERGRMLSVRRYMLRAGERVAELEGAAGVVTGEALGQKSSQTGRNLSVTSAATDLPVHRPLLSWDKTDIEQRARALDTFEDATVNVGCHRLAPPKPETNGRLSRLLEVEPDELLELAERDAEDAERVAL